MIPPAVVGIVVLAAAALGTTGLAAWASGRYSPRVARSWRSAAKELGLADDVVRIGWRGIELAAAEDQLSLSVAVKGRRGFAVRDLRDEGLHTVFAVDAATLLPPDLELGRETTGARIAKMVRGKDLVTGDDGFDRDVVVRGDRVVVAALLDRSTRVRVREAVRDGFRVAGGRLWGSVPGVMIDPPTLAATMRRLRRLMRALTPPADPVPRLADTARLDPNPGVRRQVLRLLVDRFRERQEATTTLRRALRDRDPGVRLEAALALSPEGETELRFLADRNGVPDEIRSAAVTALGDRLPPGRALYLLDVALGRALPLLAGVLVDTLGAVDSEPVRRRLMAVTRGDDPVLAARAARALGVEPGQLALAADHGGRLGLAEGGQSGSLALSEEE